MSAPRGWKIDLTDIDLGTDGLVLSSFQAFVDVRTGRLGSLDCVGTLKSRSVRVVVNGKGPVGQFTAKIMGIDIKGTQWM